MIVRTGTDGWTFVVVHVVEAPGPAAGDTVEAAVDARLALLREQPAILSLAVTMALEHFTAILAHALLADRIIPAAA